MVAHKHYKTYVMITWPNLSERCHWPKLSQNYSVSDPTFVSVMTSNLNSCENLYLQVALCQYSTNLCNEITSSGSSVCEIGIKCPQNRCLSVILGSYGTLRDGSCVVASRAFATSRHGIA